MRIGVWEGASVHTRMSRERSTLLSKVTGELTLLLEIGFINGGLGAGDCLYHVLLKELQSN